VADEQIAEFFGRIALKPNVVSGHIASVDIDAATGQQRYANVAIGSSTLRIRLDPSAPMLANGDQVRLEQYGYAASAEYRLAGIESGARTGAGTFVVLNDGTTLAGQAYDGGDVVFGKLDAGNIWIEHETGRLYHRIGSTVYGIEYPDGSQLIGHAAISGGDYAADGGNVLLDATSIKLRTALTDLVTVDGTNGIRMYSGGTQRVAIKPDGSGWFVGSNKMYWDASGNLTVAGVTADHITVTDGSNSIWLNDSGDGALAIGGMTKASAPFRVTSAGALTASSSNITGTVSMNAGSIVLGSTNKLWLNDSGDGALAIGGSVKGNAPFKVSATGTLLATNAGIVGSIDANSGTIGTLTVDGTLTVGTGGVVQSANYVSGVSGWQISNTGAAEFNSVTIRGALSAAVFEKGVVTAVAGGVIIAKGAGKLAADYTVGGTMIIENPPDSAWAFATNDIVRLKAEYAGGLADTWLTVTRTGTINQYTTVRQYGNNAITFPAGTGVVDYGQSGQGIVILTADETAYSPYIDIATHAGSPWSAMTLKARLGNLAGIGGASGYGLWSDNVFLTGALNVTGGDAATTTAAQGYANTAEANAKAASVPTTGAAADVNANATTISGGKITTGSITASQIAANTITASQIAASTITATQLAATAIDGKTITGSTVRTAASGARVEMNTTKIFGTDGTTEQWAANASDGKFVAGGGNIILGSDGVQLIEHGQAFSFQSDGHEVVRMFTNKNAGLTMLMSGTTDELLTDRSFEAGTTGWTLSTVGTGLIERTTAAARTGAYGMRFRVSAANDSAKMISSSFISVAGTNSLLVSYWYKYIPTAPATNSLSFTIEWYNSSDTLLSTSSWSHSTVGAWRQQTFTATIPANATKIKAYLQAFTASGGTTYEIYVDDISIIAAAGNQTQFDLNAAGVVAEIGATGNFEVKRLGTTIFSLAAMPPVFVPLTTPLTSTSWDGDAFSTTGKTLIDLASTFTGVPDNIKAVLLRADIRDSGAAATDAWLVLSPNNTNYEGIALSCVPANDRWLRSTVPIPCNADGNIYYQCSATGAGTLDILLQVWGYWL
jgi:hypothetical protein